MDGLLRGLSAEDFDKESGLAGPEAFRRAVEREFHHLVRGHSKVAPAIAVLRVERPSALVASAVSACLKEARRCFDVAGRLDAETFVVLLGTYWLGSTPRVTDALPLLEDAARAAAEHGAGNVRARMFWLKSEHGSAEEWFREATRWRE